MFCFQILRTGQEINEVDQSGFSTQGTTVFAGNLGGNKYIIQVTQNGVRLMIGTEQVRNNFFCLAKKINTLPREK